MILTGTTRPPGRTVTGATGIFSQAEPLVTQYAGLLQNNIYIKDTAYGDGGTVTLNISQKLDINHGGQISTNTFGNGKGGPITINGAPAISIESGGQITSNSILLTPFVSSSSTGQSGLFPGLSTTQYNTALKGYYAQGAVTGNVTVGSAGNVTVSGSSLSIDGAGLSVFTGISTNAGNINSGASETTGNGGTIKVTVTGNTTIPGGNGDISIVDGGQISASSFTSGETGFVSVIQSGSSDGKAITINGNSNANSTDPTNPATPEKQATGILAACFGTGGVNPLNPTDADLNSVPTPLAVSVSAVGTVSLSAGGEISTATFNGSAGNAPFQTTDANMNPTTVQIGGGSLDLSITSGGATNPGRLLIDGRNEPSNITANGNYLGTGVLSSTYGGADAGDVNIKVTGVASPTDPTVDIQGAGEIADGAFFGSGNGGNLNVTVTGNLNIDGDGIPIFPNAGSNTYLPTGIISSSDFTIFGVGGSTLGNSGTTALTVNGSIAIAGGGQIVSGSIVGGVGGSLDITINSSPNAVALSIDGTNTPAEPEFFRAGVSVPLPTGIVSATYFGFTAANAGPIRVTVNNGGSVKISNGGQISSGTFFDVLTPAPTAGSVTLVINSGGGLTIDGTNAPLDQNGSVTPTGILTTSLGSGQAGDATVTVSGAVNLMAGGQITLGTSDPGTIAQSEGLQAGSGDGGQLTFSAGSLTIDGTGAVSDSSGAERTGIFSSTALMPGANAVANTTEGNAGTVGLTVAGAVQLKSGGEISSSTTGTGTAGTVNLSAASLAIDGMGSTTATGIETSSSGPLGTVKPTSGTINLSVPGAVSVNNGGKIDATTSTDQSGGNIYLGGLSGDNLHQNSPSSLTVSGGEITAAAIGASTAVAKAGDVELVVAGPVHVGLGGKISSETSDQGAGGTVFLSGTNLTIDGMAMDGTHSVISSSSSSTDPTAGTGGDVGLSMTGAIALTNGGEISASTSGGAGTMGHGGSIFIGVHFPSTDPSSDMHLTAPQRNLSVPTSLTVSGTKGEIFSDTTGGGNAGVIDLNVAGPVNLGAGGKISSNSTSSDTVVAGTAGTVTLQAGSLTMNGASAISTSSSTTGTGPLTGSGNGGKITLTVPGTISLSTGAEIAATTATGQTGGDILIDQSVGNLSLSGSGTTITAASTGTATLDAMGQPIAPLPGDSGNITISTNGTVSIENSATINCSSLDSNAGPQVTAQNPEPLAISITAQQVILENHGSIDTSAPSTLPGEGNGGSVSIQVGKLFYMLDSTVITDAGDQGGNITIDPQFVVLDNSLISAHGLVDGNIVIDANFLFENGSTIEATGTVSINTVPLDLGGSLIALPSQLTDEEQRLRESCARSVNHEFSSLIVVGRGGTESAPEELQPDSGLGTLPPVDRPQRQVFAIKAARRRRARDTRSPRELTARKRLRMMRDDGRLPSLLSMNLTSGLMAGQVLQRLGSRGAATVISGTCAAAGPLVATISRGRTPLRGWTKRVVGKCARARFTARLTGIPAGGPYRLRLQGGGEVVTVAPFFVGDVWLLAGQSNMEGVGDMTGAARPHPLVRAFSMRREWRLAQDPLHLQAESPDKCHHGAQQISPEEAEVKRKTNPKGVGVGVFFGREMVAKSGVPQGLICTAHGGTSMAQWSPELVHLGGESLYGSMLASVRATGQPMAGLLWYQGESDANPKDAAEYTARMERLVAATRRDLRQPRLPWIVVQIARNFFDGVNAASWNSIQDQQRLLPGRIKFLETVAAIDLPLDDSIHIGAVGCQRLAPRLARAADRLVLGNKRESRPPQLRDVRKIKGASPWDYSIEIRYDHVVGKLRAAGDAHGFMLTTAEGRPFPLIYKTALHGDTVRLFADNRFLEGTRLSYGFGYCPVCTIVDGRGLALPVFGPLEF